MAYLNPVPSLKTASPYLFPEQQKGHLLQQVLTDPNSDYSQFILSTSERLFEKQSA